MKKLCTNNCRSNLSCAPPHLVGGAVLGDGAWVIRVASGAPLQVALSQENYILIKRRIRRREKLPSVQNLRFSFDKSKILSKYDTISKSFISFQCQKQFLPPSNSSHVIQQIVKQIMISISSLTAVLLQRGPSTSKSFHLLVHFMVSSPEHSSPWGVTTTMTRIRSNGKQSRKAH